MQVRYRWRYQNGWVFGKVSKGGIIFNQQKYLADFGQGFLIDFRLCRPPLPPYGKVLKFFHIFFTPRHIDRQSGYWYNVYQGQKFIVTKHTPPHSTANSPLFSELLNFFQQMETSVDISWQRIVGDNFGSQELQFPKCLFCWRRVTLENCGKQMFYNMFLS